MYKTFHSTCLYPTVCTELKGFSGLQTLITIGYAYFMLQCRLVELNPHLYTPILGKTCTNEKMFYIFILIKLKTSCWMVPGLRNEAKQS